MRGVNKAIIVGNYKTRKARKRDMRRRGGFLYSHQSQPNMSVTPVGSLMAAAAMLAAKMQHQTGDR